MTSLEVRISQLRDAAQNLGNASANIRNSVEASHAIVQALVQRGVISPAADQFFALYRQRRGAMSEWPDQLNDFAELLERAADAIEEAQRGQTDTTDTGGGGPQDPGQQGQGNGNQGNQGNQGQGNQGQGNSGNGGAIPPPFIPTGGSGTGTGTGGSGPGNSGNAPGHSGETGGSGSGSGGSANNDGGAGSGSGDDTTTEDAPAETTESAEPETYFNAANQQIAAQVTAKQTEITERTARITELEGQKSNLQTDLDQLLQATGGQETARTRGLRQQITDIEALIQGETTTVEQLQTQVEGLQARLEMVTPGPGADLELIQSLEGSRTIDAILNATRQADNSVNCVNWVCSNVPIPPGLPTNAKDWVQNALNHPEFGITVGDVPITGSVIVMQPEHSFAHDVFGHVMVVERVDPDGSVWVTDNFNHEPVLFSRLTDEVSGPNIQFLYLPWHSQV
jgi:hypothetical protein